jgi:hypothetical protein
MRSPCCLCAPTNVARQRLYKHVPAATIEEQLDAVFSVWSMS